MEAASLHQCWSFSKGKSWCTDVSAFATEASLTNGGVAKCSLPHMGGQKPVGGTISKVNLKGQGHTCLHISSSCKAILYPQTLQHCGNQGGFAHSNRQKKATSDARQDHACTGGRLAVRQSLRQSLSQKLPRCVCRVTGAGRANLLRNLTCQTEQSVIVGTEVPRLSLRSPTRARALLCASWIPWASLSGYPMSSPDIGGLQILAARTPRLQGCRIMQRLPLVLSLTGARNMLQRWACACVCDAGVTLH